MIRVYHIILLLVLFTSVVYRYFKYFNIPNDLFFNKLCTTIYQCIYFAYFIYSLLIVILRNSRFFYYKFYYFNFYPVYFIILNGYTYWLPYIEWRIYIHIFFFLFFFFWGGPKLFIFIFKYILGFYVRLYKYNIIILNYILSMYVCLLFLLQVYETGI